MHELSVATDIVDAAILTAKLNNAISVTSILVDVGELAVINPEQLQFMYEVITEDTILRGSHMYITVIPAETECECGYNGGVEDKFACSCPMCGKTLHVLKGKDIVLKSLEIDA